MERRAHWSDALIDAVRDAVDVEFDDIWKLSEDSILAVIAAVEDWQEQRFYNFWVSRARRLNDAEAAIQRVREAVSHGFDITDADASDFDYGYARALVDVLSALVGGAE